MVSHKRSSLRSSLGLWKAWSISAGSWLSNEHSIWAVRLSGLSGLSFGLSDSQAVRLSDCQTVGLSDCQTVKLSDCQTVRLSNCKTVKTVKQSSLQLWPNL